MPIDLSVKRVPDELADRLRERAARNHRSLQGELLAILESAVAEPEHASTSSGWTARERGRTFGVRDLYDYVSTLGQGTPDESTRWIREDRSSTNPARRRSEALASPAKPAKSAKTAKFAKSAKR